VDGRWSGAYLAIQRGGTWGRADRVPGTASLGQEGSSATAGVSCPAVGSCVAGGSYEGYETGSKQDGLFLTRLRDGHWAKAQPMRHLQILSQGAKSVFTSLSCSSVGNCSAGGFYEDSTPRLLGFVITESGGPWGQAEPVPGLASLVPVGTAIVTQISCPADGACAAVGTGYPARQSLAYAVNRT
jgi:hypothetical protein